MTLPEVQSPGAVDEAINTILESGEYQLSQETSASLSRGIGEVFQDLFSLAETWLSQVRELNPAFFVAALLASGLMLLFVAWWGLSRSRILDLMRAKEDAMVSSRLPEETPKEMRLRAHDYASQSNYLESIRWMFRAYLWERDAEIRSSSKKRTAVDAQTYQELGGLLRTTTGFSEEIAEILNLLEQGLYGEKLVSQEEYEYAAKLLEAPEGGQG